MGARSTGTFVKYDKYFQTLCRMTYQLSILQYYEIQDCDYNLSRMTEALLQLQLSIAKGIIMQKQTEEEDFSSCKSKDCCHATQALAAGQFTAQVFCQLAAIVLEKRGTLFKTEYTIDTLERKGRKKDSFLPQHRRKSYQRPPRSLPPRFLSSLH